jgi:hypothetical protein
MNTVYILFDTEDKSICGVFGDIKYARIRADELLYKKGINTMCSTITYSQRSDIFNFAFYSPATNT